MKKAKKNKIAIIGAGFRGITAAKIFQDAGFEFIILEKSDFIGGVWRNVANQSSYVQVPESEYRFDMDYSSGLPREFTPRNEILACAERFIKVHQIDQNLILQAEVISIEDISDKRYLIHYKHDNCTKSIEVDGIYYAGGRLYKPKTDSIPGEEKFKGLVGSGISDDISPSEYNGKKVVIIGCGAFAVENARTALTNGATHVTILARKINMCFPRMAMFWLNAMRLAPLVPLIKMTLKMYEWAGTNFMKDNLNDFRISQRTVPIISDFVFLAHKVGKLEFKKGSVKTIDGNKIIIDDNSEIEADIILKCFGFEGQIVKFKEIYPPFESVSWTWVNGKHNFVLDQDPDFGMTIKTTKLMTSGSTLLLTKIVANIFAMCLTNPSKFEQVIPLLPKSKEVNYEISYHMESLLKLMSVNRDVKKLLLRASAKKSQSILNKGGHKRYLEFCKAQWKQHCQKLEVNEIQYPYSSVWWIPFWQLWQQLTNSLFLIIFSESSVK